MSIVQNDQGEFGGIRHGNYGDKVEIAILDDYEYIDDGTFQYGVLGFLRTSELALELLKLVELERVNYFCKN